MIKVTKEFTFAAAHLLTGHLGLCANLHGHEYVVQVSAVRKNGDVMTAGPAEGMVIDFKDLKENCNKLFSTFDHAFFYDMNQVGKDNAEGAIIEAGKKFNLKMVPFPGRPTAENMSRHFYKTLEGLFEGGLVEIVEVKVWETPTSFATYSEA